MAESPGISADRGPVGLARLPHSRRLQRTARLAEIPVLIALRKAVAADIAELLHPAAVGRMAVAAAEPTVVAADPTTVATADSRPITIFPRPGRATFSTGPIFILPAPGNDFRVTGILVLRF